ncbi:NUDIX domain-containing protein [Streptosporangium sp. NPDC049644]|uniref:NUDIX domain-containing protein n=1 Tax=Streptosporangium sp. NPDC049644 TaxID=3155507 RepID=UPI00342B4830
MTVQRRQWADLPDPARAAIEEQTGPVVHIRSAEVGLTSGVAAHITTLQGAVFLKAAPAAAPVAGHLLRERAANQALPVSIPAPRLLWTADVADWHLLLFEHVPGNAADLSPGSPDLPAVLDAVAAISVPAPLPAPSVTGKIRGLLRTAEEHLSVSPADAAYGPLVKALDLDDVAGSTLLHADLHADNLLAAGGKVWIVDWSMACQGAAWVDVALLIPRLIDAGHTPAEAEQVATQVPAWGSAPADAVTALAAVRGLFAARLALVGPEHLRGKRARTAAACRAWVEYRTSRPVRGYGEPMTHPLVAEQRLVADAEADGITKFVVGAVVHRAGQVLILRRTEDDFLGGIEELPSGGVDPGESLAEALGRELVEEIGWRGPLDLDPGFIASFDYVSGSGRRARQWTMAVSGEGQSIALSAEHTGYRWIDPADVASTRLTTESAQVIREWAGR